MNGITELLTPLLGLILVIFGVLFVGNRKQAKKTDEELAKLNKTRAAEKEYLRRAAAKLEIERQKYEERLKKINELDLEPGEAGDSIRDRYRSTSDPS